MFKDGRCVNRSFLTPVEPCNFAMFSGNKPRLVNQLNKQALAIDKKWLIFFKKNWTSHLKCDMLRSHACGKPAFQRTRDRRTGVRELNNYKHIEYKNMKKTLIALMVLGGLAMGADTEVTYTVTNSGATIVNNLEAKGLMLNFNGTALTTTSNPIGAELSRWVELDSITLITGQSNNNNAAKDGAFSLVVTDKNFNILGWSTTTSTDNTTHTFNFIAGSDNAAVVLDTTQDYLIFADTSTSFTQGATYTHSGEWMRLGTGGVVDYGDYNIVFSSTESGKYTGLSFIGINNDGTLDTGVGPNGAFDQYGPVITIGLTKTVPEPTTATLSLLALAGLAARRRRH